MEPRPPVPPFSRDDAVKKVRAAEDAWNTRDPQKVALAYSEDSRWRNRSEFFTGRHASINDVPIAESERKFHWDLDGPRPGDHPGLSDLDL